jgi:predicted nucleotidyltransferase component of viral defense system
VQYRSPAAFRAALEARLKDEQTTEAGLSRLRKRVAFERLLARLVAIAPDAWVLKGGFALELRLGNRARSTRDVDVDWQLASADVAELLREATDLELDDYFEFTVERGSLGDDLDGGERWAVDAIVAGRLFERVAIDIGFDEPVLAPDAVASSELLAFAGVPPTTVRAIAIEQHLAEKLHAYTRIYASGRTSSRVKDLVDVDVIANTTVIDAAELPEAVDATFTRRGTHPVPAALPPPPADWAPAWRRLAADVPVPDDLNAGYRLAAELFDPILDGTVTIGRWRPGTGWTA